MLNFSQKWTSLPNDAYRPMLVYHTECISFRKIFTINKLYNSITNNCKIKSESWNLGWDFQYKALSF